MLVDQDLLNQSAEVLEALRKSGLTIGTVESCTGGLVAAVFTEIPGASDVFQGGLVVYSNGLKQALAHVSASTLERHGAVSRECALELALGGRKALGTDVVVAITGIAGPTGGTDEKPVGTTHLAILYRDRLFHAHRVFRGSRDTNRIASVHTVLEALLSLHESGRAEGFEEVVT